MRRCPICLEWPSGCICGEAQERWVREGAETIARNLEWLDGLTAGSLPASRYLSTARSVLTPALNALALNEVRDLSAPRETALVRMLEKATVRLEILAGRLRACPSEEKDGVHGLSLFEIEGWIEEQRAFTAP